MALSFAGSHTESCWVRSMKLARAQSPIPNRELSSYQSLHFVAKYSQTPSICFAHPYFPNPWLRPILLFSAGQCICDAITQPTRTHARRAHRTLCLTLPTLRNSPKPASIVPPHASSMTHRDPIVVLPPWYVHGSPRERSDAWTSRARACAERKRPPE